MTDSDHPPTPDCIDPDELLANLQDQLEVFKGAIVQRLDELDAKLDELMLATRQRDPRRVVAMLRAAAEAAERGDSDE